MKRHKLLIFLPDLMAATLVLLVAGVTFGSCRLVRKDVRKDIKRVQNEDLQLKVECYGEYYTRNDFR